MKKYIELYDSKEYVLPVMTDEEIRKSGKGWSYSNVYSLRELKDIYILIANNQGLSNGHIADLANKYILPVGKDWDSNGRRVLEQINALKNFKLIDGDNYISRSVFNTSTLNSELTEKELETFTDIFFSYVRFREIIMWFMDVRQKQHESINKVFHSSEVLKNSVPIFTFSYKTRFTDAIIYNLNNSEDIYVFDPSMTHLLRFWDVFLSWASTLKLIEKFSMRDLDYQVYTGGVDKITPRRVSCIYFVQPNTDFNLVEFIKDNYRSKQIYVPDLVFKLAIRYRMTIQSIKDHIIKQAVDNSNAFTFERTSEIFIRKSELKESETLLFPKFKNSFISHISVR